ncbi:hypothetical protein FB567DRAFT_530900 [Paraphoma chrysanthemicola]|uniref:Homeobox domain-containing protein n=1 Tax=Paraphoma chrysanthemicola TaxID=798071 RepID=A0A8K0VWY0_9PLEO|nr:hypothetical protein FB567DRAFT_530900 [Paraphoma chrysanthemicola]
MAFNMATSGSHACDNMDEFFDFDQLEHDHDAHVPDSVCYQSAGMYQCLDDDMTMDWTVDPAPLPFGVDLMPRDIHMPNIFGDINFHDVTNWPLVDNIQIDSAAVETQPLSSLAPSSSLDFHRPTDIIGSHNVEAERTLDSSPGRPLPGLPLDSEQPTAPRAGVQTTPSKRPGGPLRQASISSWKPASAKRKGPQSRIPLEARQILEDEFVANPYPCSWELDIIAHQANLDVKKVRNWFNNTRARKKGDDVADDSQKTPDALGRSLDTRLSKDSLEALDKDADADVQPPQPLAVYLAQSYQEEAIELPAIQAAIETESLDSSGAGEDAWSNSRRGRTGSVITSVASSEGTAPTTYTVSSSGSRSNISSFGRDRRRGRRRMAWKESPHNTRPKYNGVNSAGEPQKDLPFYCTFCPRAFKTKYEWVRHEDSVHALRTTWICCDTKPTAIECCPFCGHMHPDDDHMAGHKYQQCRSKPETQRTFYRRDHFVQHLHHVHFANTKHPSVRAGCQARLMGAEGHNFGCKDLAMKWRRFGAPMKQDDPMLHCGMCGKKSKDWSERCEHVAEHLIAREHDRSAWWSERREQHLENLYSTSPFESFRCRYCLKIFTDIAEMNEHSHCKVWSCRFLKSFDDVTADNAGPPLCPDFPSAKAHHCHLCGAGYRTPHAEHAQNYHRYRSCNQEFYTSEEAFLQHLHNFHGASLPALLQGNSIIEQNYMRNKGASFEPVEFNESWQPCLMDLDSTPIGPFTVDKPAPASALVDKKSTAYAKKQAPTRKKIRDDNSSSSTGSSTKPQRSRSDTTTSRGESTVPRFFRLSTYVPILSSRVFLSRSSKPSEFPRDNESVIEEIPKPHVASLAMSAGLVSMAAIRWPIQPQKSSSSGVVELVIEEAD